MALMPKTQKANRTQQTPGTASGERSWSPPAGAPRIAIVQVLGLSDAPMTIREIEAEVTALIPVRDTSAIEEHLQSLVDVEHVAKLRNKKVFELTESGRAYYESIRPFSKG